MKTCPRCGDPKSLNDFGKNRSKPDGRQVQCRKCKKLSDQKYHAANRAKQLVRNKNNRQLCVAEIAEFKAKCGCKICDEKEPCCLDFHHQNKDKESTVSDLATNGCRNRMWIEIKKCVVVCSNCHRKIHAGLIPC